eukprot:COSAG05_NODE_5994_length_1043_cov_1.368644_1_plen_61_part_00
MLTIRPTGPRGRELDPTEMQFEPVDVNDSVVTQLGEHYGLPADFPYHLHLRFPICELCAI